MNEKKKNRLTNVFQVLSKAYEEIGIPGLNAERVTAFAYSMKIESGFFHLPPPEQARKLNFMKEIHIGRGERFYHLENKSGLDHDFWAEFKMAIEEYLDDIIVKSYPFPSE